MKRKILIFFTVIVALGAFFWLSQIAKCEILSARHAAEFENLWQEYTMLREPDELIVLEYTDTTARVYHRSQYGGNILSYARTDPGAPWEFAYWDTIWSQGGSADDFIWPYIR